GYNGTMRSLRVNHAIKRALKGEVMSTVHLKVSGVVTGFVFAVTRIKPAYLQEGLAVLRNWRC
ncbi:hypothetical protein QN361_24395, partial [Pseudomonas sp. 5C2]|nr:hypothetical protein [Pseudomonas sp. 5C2]